MKTYIFSFNVGQIDPEIIRLRLNNAPEISDWLVMTGGLAIIKSRFDVSELAGRIRSSFPGMQFLMSEVNPTSCDGWVPQAVWDFVNQPQRQAISA